MEHLFFAYRLTPLSSSTILFGFRHMHARHLLQSFLLKVVTPKENEHSSVVKSVPCAAGSSNELCMVEVRTQIIYKLPTHGLYFVHVVTSSLALRCRYEYPHAGYSCTAEH